MPRTTQYVLWDKNADSPAYMTHQDDEETPMVAADLTSLISWVSDWADMGEADALQEMQPGGELEQYEFRKQAVADIPLSADDRAVIATAAAGDDDEEDDDDAD